MLLGLTKEDFKLEVGPAFLTGFHDHVIQENVHYTNNFHK